MRRPLGGRGGRTLCLSLALILILILSLSLSLSLSLTLTLTLHPHPHPHPRAHAQAHPHPHQVAGLLRGRFDVVLAADVINAEGLSELVFAIVRRYRACPGSYPKGRASRGAGVARGG